MRQENSAMSADVPFELSRLTWQEAHELLKRQPVGLLPIGALEAHGPHLPLNTDVIIAQATAERAAVRLRELGLPVLILPPIIYSVSFVGTSFAGTTPVDPDPFEAYLTSLLSNAASQGYRAIVCCNAHLEPAHVERVTCACAQATQAAGIPVLFPDQRSERFSAFLSEEFRAGARHAGSYETSIVLAAAPDHVRQDALTGLPPVWIDLPGRLRDGARTFLEAGAELGYFGNPALATPAEGHQMLDALADIVVLTLREAGILAAG
jgi:creatinine amidohydrolase